MSSQVTGDPSCHETPSRSVKDQALRDGSTLPAVVARSPSTVRWRAASDPAGNAVRVRTKTRPAKAMSSPVDMRCGSQVATGPSDRTVSRPVSAVLPPLTGPTPLQADTVSATTAAPTAKAPDLRTCMAPSTRSGVARPRRAPSTNGLVELDLADADRLGRHLDALVLAAELE